MGHKFESTYRVSYAFEIVTLTVCEVVHRIYFPLIACAMVWVLDDAIHNRIAEVHIRRCHVDFSAKNASTFFKFAGIHAFEQVEVFFGSAVTIWAFGTRGGGCAFLSSYLFRSLVVDISLAFFNHSHGEVV